MHMLLTEDATTGAAALYEQLQTALKHKKVLWLVTGGSNMPIAAGIMKHLDESLTANLTVALTDERFGAHGHPDSNWQQLLDIGFKPGNARCIPVLTEAAVSMEDAADIYSQTLQAAWQEQDLVIGQFGMGPDGHIAGILPDSPAARAGSWVTSYHTEQYDRITLTFPAIRHCNTIYLFAYGRDRRHALKQLQKKVPLGEQPAQIIKEVSDSYVYNDQIGEHS